MSLWLRPHIKNYSKFGAAQSELTGFFRHHNAENSGKPRLPVKIGLAADDGPHGGAGGDRRWGPADPSLAGAGGGSIVVPTLETFGVKLVAGAATAAGLSGAPFVRHGARTLSRPLMCCVVSCERSRCEAAHVLSQKWNLEMQPATIEYSIARGLFQREVDNVSAALTAEC